MIFAKQADLRGFILPEGVLIKGSLETNRCGRIDGVVEGNVFLASRLVIGITGVVIGTVKAENIIVEGKVTGDIICDNHADIAGSAYITGVVTCKTVGVSGNAFIGGGINKTNASGEKGNNHLPSPIIKKIERIPTIKNPTPDVSPPNERDKGAVGQTWF